MPVSLTIQSKLSIPVYKNMQHYSVTSTNISNYVNANFESTFIKWTGNSVHSVSTQVMCLSIMSVCRWPTTWCTFYSSHITSKGKTEEISENCQKSIVQDEKEKQSSTEENFQSGKFVQQKRWAHKKTFTIFVRAIFALCDDSAAPCEQR